MIGVIADDLTGAAEIGAVDLRHGLQSEIFLAGHINSKADLVCVDTDSRSCVPAEAARRTVFAAKQLREAGANWIYKKVDSVLRGNVAVETEAAMRELGLPLALMLPENPARGRAIRDGRYFVDGKLIHETEFARDPEHPRTSADVRELLAAPRTMSAQAHDELPESGIIICEAATSGEVQQWAARVSRNIFSVGGAEFFSALLAARGCAAVRVESQKNSSRDGELFVCGTTSESSRKFVSAARAGGTPVFSLPQELARGGEFATAAKEAIAQEAVTALQSQRRVILQIGLPSVGDHKIAAGLAVHLTELAELVLKRTEVGHVFAEGGATAAALARRMGWSRLTVAGELSPGVATLAVDGNKSLLLTIKPGSYAWPDVVRNG